MKKSLIQILLFATAALLVLSSCEDKRVKYFTSTISIDESAFGDIPKPESYEVTFTNINTGDVRSKTSLGPNVTVDSLVNGIYDVVAQAQFSHAGYAYNYIGTAKNVEVTADGVQCVIKVNATKAAALVFKEIYYNSCKDNNNANYMKDLYVEIYNNSDQVVYADGVTLAMTLSPETYEWKYGAGAYEKDGVKYDVGIPDDDKYVFVGMTVWQIPGNGTTYPIQPGESFVIAGYAKNHTETASQSINLSTAEFETYCDHYGEKGQSDCNAINMNLVAAVSNPTNNFWLTVTGRGAIIFHQETPIRSTDFLRSSNYPTSFGLEVLKADVIDAVDLVANATTKKWVDPSLDAGKVLSQGNYCGKSILRKIASTTAAGTIVLQDTNNSTEDFIYNGDAAVSDASGALKIRRYGVGRPSWSTWTTAQ